jgi:hypothetical protein
MRRQIAVLLLAVIFTLPMSGCDIICSVIDCPPPPEDGEPQLTGVLFFDDFEGGADPAWRPAPGSTWMVKEGRYTIAEDSPIDLPMRTFVGSSSWQDYSVQVEVFEGGSRNQVAILLRVQDEDNMVGFFVVNPGVYDYAVFKIRKDGIWREVGPRYSWGWSSPVNFLLLVTIQGDTYSASVNAENLVTVEIPDAPAGGYVGLQAAYWGNVHHITAFDNFKVMRR